MTVKKATIDSIEIENREVAIDVVAPGRMQMEFFVIPRLPDAVLDDDIPDDALTLDEQADAAYELIDATTDLPRDLIEQLPASAIEELSEAATLVINQQTRLWECRDDVVTATYEFVAKEQQER